MEQRKHIIAAFPTSRPVGREWLIGILNYARRCAWEVRIANDDDLLSRLSPDDRTSADGVIYSLRSRLRGLPPPGSLPTVVIDSAARGIPPGCSLLEVDNADIGIRCADYLLAKKLPHFGFVGFSDADWSEQRAEAFAERIRQAGRTCSRFPFDKSRRHQGERRMFLDWVTAQPKPFGLLTGCDAWGRTVLDWLFECKIKIPNEVCVLSVDDDTVICENTQPTLSSIRAEYVRQGLEAARMLNDMMSGGEAVVRRHCFGRIVERASSMIETGRLRCAVNAREFIRVNACSLISVNDVVASTRASRRLVELRFREAYGHSLNEEIQSVRIDHAKHYLRNTTLSITEICGLCGFQSPSQLKRLFKQKTGLSMRDFRMVNYT